LAWTGAKPSTGLPAAARHVRHALLAEAARQAGARVILMGHTAGDVAEGEAMRVADVPGIGRLREWAPSPVWPEGRGVFVFRPLLSVERETLRDVLRARGQSWLDDPANDNPAHPRVRARRALVGAEAIIANVPDMDPAIASLARQVRLTDDGAAFSLRTAFRTAPDTVARHVLAAALLCVSGTSRPPRGDALGRMLALIRGYGDAAATLAGVRVESRGEALHLTHEPGRKGAVPSPYPAAPRFAAACGLITTEGEAEL
jgi:tRNA(Ile)-lysidine synthase